MGLDPEKKAELVERLKLARQKKLELKKKKDTTEVKQPMIEKPVEVEEKPDAVVEKPAVVEKEKLTSPKVDKKEKLTSPKVGKAKNQKDKFMKIVFYKEPKQQTLNRIQSVLDSDDEDDEIKLPPKVKSKPVKTPRVKEESKSVEPKLDERQAYLKQLASMYY